MIILYLLLIISGCSRYYEPIELHPVGLYLKFEKKQARYIDGRWYDVIVYHYFDDEGTEYIYPNFLGKQITIYK